MARAPIYSAKVYNFLNRVKNPSFENLTAAGGSEPDRAQYWTKDYETTGAGGTYDNDTVNHRRGSRGLRIIVGATTAGTSIASKSFPVVAGETYHVIAWAKGLIASADGLWVRFATGDVEDFARGHASFSFTDIVSDVAVPTAWTQYRGNVVVPAGDTWARIVLYLWQPSTVTSVAFDDIMAVKNTEAFAVGDLVADFENVKNLGYAHYVNDVGEAFFTVNQGDSKASLLSTLVDDGGHLKIYRNSDNVWSGWLGETDEANNDAIFYANSYEAGLFERQTDWGQEFIKQDLDDIISALWDRARGITPAADYSRMRWMTTGTLEVPVTTSGGATPINLETYRTYFKRVLFAFQELVAMALSDTTNRVVFEITPAGVLNLWKNRGSDSSTLAFHYGDPKVLGYRRQRAPVDHRNVIYAVATSPRDVTLRATQSDGTDVSTSGQREESIFLQWVRDADELDRVSKLRLQRALRDDSAIAMTFAPGKLIPFRATGQSYKLTDGVPVFINNGATQVNGEVKLIVGQQVIVYRGQEIVRPILADRL